MSKYAMEPIVVIEQVKAKVEAKIEEIVPKVEGEGCWN
jgi:hypothetical protein